MKPKETCPKCGKEVILVQYAYNDKYHYDGVSERACISTMNGSGKCDWRIGRWCEQELKANEVEKPFCDGTKNHPRIFDLTK